MSAPGQAPTEIIEAAARAEWIVQCEQSQIFTASLGLPGVGVVPWEDVAEPIRERTRERVRPAVQAAWPLIAARELNEAADEIEANEDEAWAFRAARVLRARSAAQIPKGATR